MGIINTNQILKGARTPIQSKPYVIGGVKVKPTAAVTANGSATDATSTVSFTGGTIEFDGREFSLNSLSLNFGTSTGISTSIKVNTKYLVCAVPDYVAPVDRAAATTAGVNYYVASTDQGEHEARFFIPTAVESAIDAEGGYARLSDTVYKGSPTQYQINLFNQYTEELEKVTDPRYVGRLLRISGVKFVVVEVEDQDNVATANKLSSLSLSDFTKLKSTTNLYERRVVYSQTDAIAAFETASKLHLVARDSVNLKIKRYANQSNADNDVSPTATTFAVSSATPFTTGSSGTDYFAVYEYHYPATMPLEQTGYEQKKLQILNINNNALLGRIDPIYMANNFESARWARKPLGALTLHADPIPLVEVKTQAALKRLDSTYGTSGIIERYEYLY